jgi:hypothetical protein
MKKTNSVLNLSRSANERLGGGLFAKLALVALAVVLGAGLPLACDNPVFESAALKGASDLGGDAPVIETPVNEVTVYSANELQSALTSGKINVINVAKSFDSNVSSIVTVPKTIKIEKNYRVRIAALHTKAAVTLAPGNAQSAQSVVSANIVADTAPLLAAGEDGIVQVSQADIGIFEIKKTLIVAAGTDISVKTGTNLVLGEEVTAQTTKIDGSLAQDEAGLIYHLGGGVTVSGDGGITSGGASGKEIASGAILGAPAGGMPVELADKPQTVNVNGNDEGTDGGDEEPPEDEEEEEEEHWETDPPNIVKVTSIALKAGNDDVQNGGTITMTADTMELTAVLVTDPMDEEAEVSWISDRPMIISVAKKADSNNTAVVTKHSGGSATILAKAGGKTASCTVMASKTAGLYASDDDSLLLDLTQYTDGKAALDAAFEKIKDGSMSKTKVEIVLGINVSDNTAAGYTIGTGTTGASTGTKTNLTITISGTSGDVTIEKTAAGALFTVIGVGTDDIPELILENITLKGYSSNNKGLVTLGATGATFPSTPGKPGTLTMKAGSRITGNVSSGNNVGGGVTVLGSGTLNMEGGEISGNESTANAAKGGGVNNGGTFNMTGGTISGNKAGNTASGNNVYGAGVYTTGAFTMSGGEIKGNVVLAKSGNNGAGGGVSVATAGNFTMEGTARIEDNTAPTYGGGVYINTTNDTQFFEMKGGVILKNTAGTGAAVCVYSKGWFKKIGGTIYGNDSADANIATGASGHVIEKRASASAVTCYYDGTADESVTLDSSDVNQTWSK